MTAETPQLIGKTIISISKSGSQEKTVYTQAMRVPQMPNSVMRAGIFHLPTPA